MLNKIIVSTLIIIAQTPLVQAANISDECFKKVEVDFISYIKRSNSNNEFDKVSKVDFEYVQNSISDSIEIADNKKESLISKLKSKNYHYYEGMYNYRSGTGLYILAVNPLNCKTLSRIFWYSE